VTERQRQILIVNGIGLLIGAIAIGWVFFFFLLHEIVLWPVIPAIAIHIPGDERAWRMAHMEGLTQGLLLIAIGAVGGRLRLSAREAWWLEWSALVTGWLFFLPASIGPFFGARGLAFGGGPFGASLANDVMYLCGWPPVICVHVMLALLLLGALRKLRELPRASA
jgi:hypothetical protein